MACFPNVPSAHVVRADAPGDYRLALDRLFERMSFPAVNPLGTVLRAGQRVVVKPNLSHHRQAAITAPGLIRAVCDRAFEAVGRAGEVTLGDGPFRSCHWPRLLGETGIERWPEEYARQGFWLTLADFRRFTAPGSTWRGRSGDPRGYRTVKLDSDSPSVAAEYLISGSVLAADALINLPKLKARGQGGLSCAMENLLGIDGNRDCLPNYPGVSGIAPVRASVPGGGAQLRTVLDLNRIACYADRQGCLQPTPQRTILTIADVLMAGCRVEELPPIAGGCSSMPHDVELTTVGRVS